MKASFRTLISYALLASACTPIAPSVHKSVLRPGDSERILPGSSPSPSAAQRLTPSAGSRTNLDDQKLLIEARWITEDEALSREIDLTNKAQLIRLSSEQSSRLKAESLFSVNLPEEFANKKLARIRLLVRVQMSSERLEKSLSEESWDFAVSSKSSEDSSRVLQISHADNSAIAESLVSVHILFEERQ
jgi:hypothetical protein